MIKTRTKNIPASIVRASVNGQDTETVKYIKIHSAMYGPIELAICQRLFFRQGTWYCLTILRQLGAVPGAESGKGGVITDGVIVF